MHACKFQERRNAIKEAHQKEPVEGSRVSHFGQIRAWVQTDGGKSKHSRYPKPNTIRRSLQCKTNVYNTQPYPFVWIIQ